ncbi:MAG: enoyl-CoA hydratase [Parasphingorhabdus sp.]|jgi:enoyl-CoA hydratase
MSNQVITQHSEGVLTLRLNRPASYNAWTTAMRDELTGLLEKSNTDDSIKAVILTGTGNDAFCAGQDLAETQKFSGYDNVREWLDHLRRFYDAIRGMEKPLVAALNGLAAGSGFQVTLMSDVVVAHQDVKMGQTEVNSGIPSIFGPWLMTEYLGRARAVELSVTGRLMDADECFRLGVIQQMVKPEEVLSTAHSIALDLASKPPVAMRLTKKYLKLANEAEYDNAFRMAEHGEREAYLTGEPQVVMEEFFAIRKARKST